ncbi:AAC(3) family N-acetyltransferase [Candidatus Poribacteria bacterium]|nr:AAC(3) family N-acetyltransferase [Candidatus Poribacteria bacterium]
MLNEEKTQIQIANDLKALGLREGGVLLVHASLRSLGKVPGGAETIVRGLLHALGENGTLIMPALSYAHVDVNNPVFDVLNTRSCVGALPEYFRTLPGTIRSVHPTHSVSGVGAKAESLLKEHYLDITPCGEHSPFRRLRKVRGQILFLGCGLRPNTSMHAVEELVQPPYLLGNPVEYRIILAPGKEIKMRVRRHNFGIWAQRYDRLGTLLDENGLKKGKVLEATVDLIDCEQMWERALIALKKEPFFFVEKRH